MFIIKWMITVLRWLVRPSSMAAPGTAAVVQTSVLSGARPALKVVRGLGGLWEISDGWSDTSAPGAAVTTTLSHAAMRDGSIASLQTMSYGTVARRAGIDAPWIISPLYV
jgi:hypothetical protein